MEKKQIIVVDGIIGAGKSVLCNLLSQRIKNSVYIPEPVEEWKDIGILQEFYASLGTNAQKYLSYEFQTYTFLTRVKKTIEYFEKFPEAECFILERSIYTDKLFIEMQKEIVGEMRMKMYYEWWNLWKKIYPIDFDKHDTTFVYLDTSINESLKRVDERDRSGELVSYGYQTKLREMHQNMFDECKEKKIHINSSLADSDFKKDVKIFDEIFDMILR
jgi:deoxyadenosine/deoxycytidine kinase